MHQQLRAIATVLSLINPAILFARAVAGHSLARPHFFAIQIIFFILIAMYCTVRELVA
jgi:hypothetical protein